MNKMSKILMVLAAVGTATAAKAANFAVTPAKAVAAHRPVVAVPPPPPRPEPPPPPPRPEPPPPPHR